MLSLTKIQKACEQVSNPEISALRERNIRNSPPPQKSPKPS